MEQDSKSTLKIYSVLLLVLGLIDVFLLVLAGFQGDFNAALVADAHGTTESIALFAIIFIIAIEVIILAFKLYLGFRGLGKVNGTYTGKGCEKAGMIALVFCVIALVCTVINTLTTGSSWFELASPAAGCIIVYEYIKAAKETA